MAPQPGGERAANSAYPALRRPVTIGGLELPNRIVMAPMTTYGLPDPDGASNDRHRAYYARRTRVASVGLVRVKSAMVHVSGKCWPITLLAPGERAMDDAHPLVAGTTGLRLAGHGGSTITGVTLRGVVDGHLEVAVDGETRRVGPFDLLVSAIGWRDRRPRRPSWATPGTPSRNGCSSPMPPAWRGSCSR